MGRVVRRPERLAIPTADGVEDAERRDDVEPRAIYDPGQQAGAAAVLRDRPRRGAHPVGRDGQAHVEGPRPQGAGQPDGRRLRAPALRAGAGSARLLAEGGYQVAREQAAWRSHLLSNWGGCGSPTSRPPGWATPPRSARRSNLRAEVELPGPGDRRRAGAGRLRPVDDTDGLHDVNRGAMTHEVHRGSRTGSPPRSRWSAPGTFGYRCGCCPPRRRWPPRPSSRRHQRLTGHLVAGSSTRPARGPRSRARGRTIRPRDDHSVRRL